MAEQNLALQIYQSVVGIVGICGNGLVCLVIARVRFMHTLTNAFIFNQALIDLLGSLLILVNSLVPVPDPIPPGTSGVLLCKLWVSNFFVWGLFIASTFNLTALTLERYLAIVFPFRYQVLATREKSVAVIIGLWLSAFVFNSYSLFIRYYEAGQCRQRLVANPLALGVAVFSVTYLLPVVVMVFVYTHIAVVLKKGAGRVQPKLAGLTPGPPPGTGVEPTVATANAGAGDQQQGAGPSGTTAPEGRGESLMRARRNTFKTLLLVSVAFTVCWTPNEVIFFLFNLGVDVDFTSVVYIVSVAMVASNGCVNPFIYAIKYKQFRKALKALTCAKSGTDVGSSLTATNNNQE
ncbi:beta-3 adrenergic receptor-like [Acanthaster planci]|uniref:Beta-3 adrenergic receptor-like n=1 Tax=Acanthaster planci TaxID=133434 RepID=A0A8B7YM36_ACAPL|nr:beta-3 adrenergic receptor-like [Acanthaster planci]